MEGIEAVTVMVLSVIVVTMPTVMTTAWGENDSDGAIEIDWDDYNVRAMPCDTSIWRPGNLPCYSLEHYQL